MNSELKRRLVALILSNATISKGKAADLVEVMASIIECDRAKKSCQRLFDGNCSKCHSEAYP